MELNRPLVLENMISYTSFKKFTDKLLQLVKEVGRLLYTKSILKGIIVFLLYNKVIETIKKKTLSYIERKNT